MKNKRTAIQELREKLEELEAQPDPTLDEDEISRLLFRMDNIGFNIKRIADSLSEIKGLLRKGLLEEKDQ
jgi:predicted  nucleic acid-binding Zn-ribbon protein